MVAVVYLAYISPISRLYLLYICMPAVHGGRRLEGLDPAHPLLELLRVRVRARVRARVRVRG